MKEVYIFQKFYSPLRGLRQFKLPMIKLFNVLIFLFLLGCSNNQSERINMFRIKLANLEKSFLELNLNKVNNAYTGYKENIDLVRSCVDTLEKSFSIRMNNYKGLKKTCPKFLSTFSIAKKNLEDQIFQVQNLSKDLEHNLIPIDSINVYLDLESENIQKISDDVLELLELYKFINSVSDSLYEPIKLYAEKFCSKKVL